METCIDDVESIEGLFFHAEDFVEQASLFALEGVKLLLPDRPNIDKRKSLANAAETVVVTEIAVRQGIAFL